eukprot:3641815-Pleurochrysis_carterae.AAC.1
MDDCSSLMLRGRAELDPTVHGPPRGAEGGSRSTQGTAPRRVAHAYMVLCSEQSTEWRAPLGDLTQ